MIKKLAYYLGFIALSSAAWATTYTRTIPADTPTANWASDDAWTTEESATVAKPESESDVTVTLTQDTTLIVDEVLTLNSLTIEGGHTLTLKFSGATVIEKADYLNVLPFTSYKKALLTTTAITGSFACKVTNLKYGATGTIATTTTGAIVAIALPLNLFDVKSINVNFSNNATNKISDATSDGLYPVAGQYWTQTTAASGTDVAITIYDSSSKSTESQASALTYSSKNTWGCGATPSLLKGYLDDGSGVTVGITLPDGFGSYTAIVYAATDTASTTFSSKTVNGTAYTFKDGQTVSGSDNWGASSSRSELSEGVNALVVTGQSATTFALSSTIGTNNRGCMTGVQLVQEKVPTLPTKYSATLSANTQWSKIQWTQEDSLEIFDFLPNDAVLAQITVPEEGAILTIDTMISLPEVQFEGGSLTIKYTDAIKPAITKWDFSEVTSATVAMGGVLGNVTPPTDKTVVVDIPEGTAFTAGYTPILTTSSASAEVFSVSPALVTGQTLTIMNGQLYVQLATVSTTFTPSATTDWADRTLPATAKPDLVTATSSASSYVQNTAYNQTLGESDQLTTVVSLEGATTTTPDVFALGYQPTDATLTKDIYLTVSGGDYGIVTGGQEAHWENTQRVQLTGNILTQMTGGTAKNVIGAGHKAGTEPTVTGNTGVTIEGKAIVKGSIVGGWTSSHNSIGTVSGNTSVLVKNVQSVTDETATLTDMPAGWIVGAGARIANTASKTTVGGNASVTIDLPDTATGTFVKHIVGGGRVNEGGTYGTVADAKQIVKKDALVSILSPNAVTFTGNIYGGGYAESKGTVSVEGNTSVAIEASKETLFSGNIYGGGYQTGEGAATVAGTATVSLKGGTYTGGLKDGWNSGGATLTFPGSETTETLLKGASIGNFNALSITGRVAVQDTVTFTSTSVIPVTSTTGEIQATTASATVSGTAGISLTDEQTLTLSAKAGQTLTVSMPISGEGKLIVGKSDQTGTVLFDSNVFTNYTGALTLASGTVNLGTNRPKIASVTDGVTLTVVATLAELSEGSLSFNTTLTEWPTSVTVNVFAEDGSELNLDVISISEGKITFPVSTKMPMWTATETETNNTWSNKDCWSTGSVPTSGVSVIVNFGSTATSLTIDSEIIVNELKLMGDQGGEIKLSGDAASLTATTLTLTTNVTLPASGVTTSPSPSIKVLSEKTLTLSVAENDERTVGAVISGEGAVTKTGNGTLNLSGANTYTGTTTISEGTLKLTNATMSATPITIVTGATLDLAQTTETTFLNAISGAGNVTVSSTVVKLSTLGSTGTLTIAEGATLDVTALTEDAPLSNAIVLEGTLRYAGTGDAGIVTGNISSTTSKGSLDVTNGGLSLFGTTTNYQGSINVATGSKLFTKDTITLGNAATLNLQGTIVGGAYAARYVRWTPLARPTTGNNHTGVALAEFKFLLNGEAVPWDTTTISIASDHISGGHVASNLKDGNITSTKWYWETSMETFSNTECPVVFDAGENKTLTFNGYNLAMADQNGRNPTQWTLEISDDNSTWVTIDTRTYTDAEVLLWNTWAWLTTPFSLEKEETPIQLKVEGTLSGSGAVGMPVIFGNDAKLDASMGPATVKTLTLNGTVTTTLPTAASEGTYLIKCGGTTTPSDALKFACTETTLCVAPKPAGYQLIAAPTVTVPTGVELPAGQKKEVQDVAVANGITDPVTLNGKTSKGEVKDGMLECFEGGTTLTADTDKKTVSITYDFGITTVTPSTVTAKVQGAKIGDKPGAATFKDGVKLTLLQQAFGSDAEPTQVDGTWEIEQGVATFTPANGTVPTNTKLTVKATLETETATEE